MHYNATSEVCDAITEWAVHNVQQTAREAN